MPKLLKYSTTSGGGNTSKKEFISVRVIDIILNNDHPRATSLGGVDAIGTIFYGDISSEKGIDNSETLPTAKPLFSYQKYLPLINEIVLLTEITINKDNKSKEKIKLYLPNINIWNSPHHNAMPLTEYYKNGNKGYSSTQDGVIKNPQDNLLNIPLGKTFQEKDFIKPLRPFEGDNILEGKLDINNDDSSIYLTSNQNINNFTPTSKNMQSYGKGMDVPYMSPEDKLINPIEEDLE